jgi:hypothetical protein
VRPSPRSSRDAFIGGCLSLLLGALALYVAVRLIEAVWVALAVIASIVACVALVTMVVRRRSGGW